MNKKMNIILGTVLVAGLLTVGCSSSEAATDTTTETGTDVTVEAEELETEEATEETPEAEATSNEALTDIGIIAQSTVESYFHPENIAELNAVEEDFSEEIKTVNFTEASTEKFKFNVRVSTTDLQPIMIQSSQAEDLLLVEMKNATNSENPTTKDLYDYKYSLTPATEEESLQIVDEFIAASPLADLTIEHINTTFEYRFNTQDKEYFVFEYKVTDAEGNSHSTFVKIDNYMKVVTEIVGLS